MGIFGGTSFIFTEAIFNGKRKMKINPIHEHGSPPQATKGGKFQHARKVQQAKPPKLNAQHGATNEWVSSTNGQGAEKKEVTNLTHALKRWIQNALKRRIGIQDVLNPLQRGELSNLMQIRTPLANDIQSLCVGERRRLRYDMQTATTSLRNTRSKDIHDVTVPALVLRLWSGRHTRIAEIVDEIFDLQNEETGHSLRGHCIIDRQDRALASMTRSSLLYGELLHSAVTKMLAPKHLSASTAETLFDLGMGLGKVGLQAFLEFPNLKTVVGVELSEARAMQAKDALHAFYHFLNEQQPKGGSCWTVTIEDFDVPLVMTDSPAEVTQSSLRESSTRLTLTHKSNDVKRVLEVRHQNLFDTHDSLTADIVICQTHFPKDIQVEVVEFLSKMKEGAQLLTYENIAKIHEEACASDPRHDTSFPFRRNPTNHSDDRYFTSWAVNNGHHFHLWSKVDQPSPSRQQQGSQV